MADVDVIEAGWVQFDSGCRLLDGQDNFILELGEDFAPDGSEVSRNVYATIHGTARLRVARLLAWQVHRLQPWIRVTAADGATVERNLGVYVLANPVRNPREAPETFDVQAYDKLQVLNYPLGYSVSLAAGEPVLPWVRGLIAEAGESKVAIDSLDEGKVAAALKVWPVQEARSRLTVINEALALIGYRGLWVDRDGWYRSEPYVAPSSIAPFWTYSADSPTTTVREDRTETVDFFDVPNRWVFCVSNPATGTFPTEGAGLYTVLNVADGITSVTARGGRVITAVVKLDAVDQASLVVQGDRIVEQDKRLDRRVTMMAGLNPLHWHFDTVDYADARLGATARMLVTSWSMPLGGGDMKVELKGV